MLHADIVFLCWDACLSVTLLAVTYLRQKQVEGSSGGHVPIICCCCWKVRECRYKDAPVGWSLEASFGHASHYIFVFVLMSPSCPRPSSRRRRRATFCPLHTIEPFLPWYFLSVFWKGSVHARAHILRRKHSAACALRARVGSFTLYLIFLCLLKDSEGFPRHWLRFSKYVPHPFQDQNY